MPLTINSNINALTAQRSMVASERLTTLALQRLSSGLRINSAKDDAAGMAISARMTSQVRGLNQAARNANDGISMAQTAEGALSSSSAILQRVRELAVQSANATNSAGDRQALNREASQLIAELGRISQNTEFNGQKLLDGATGSQLFQVGANANQTIVATASNMTTSTYGAHLTNGNDGAGAGAVLAAWGINNVGAGSLAIASNNGSTTVNVSANQSAKDIAAAINAASATTGVTASAKTTVRLFFLTASSHTVNIRSSNSAPVTVHFDMDNLQADGYEQVAAAFNAVSTKTGVTAKTGTIAGGLVRVFLTNAAGDDIQISDTGNATQADLGLIKHVEDTATDTGPSLTLLSNGAVESAVVSGTLSLTSASSFNVNSSTNAYVAGASSSSLNSVASLDISTSSGAQKAIQIADAALKIVSAERAKLGALQSRFEAATTNLQVSAENLSASRSRIEDADFATETATLSKAQILQQASTAMVAQANQLHKQVLTLLQ